MSETLLLDAPLVPDPDEAFELSDTETTAFLTDDEVKDARFNVKVVSVERVADGLAVALKAGFDPMPRSRFTYARVSIRAIRPDDLEFVDFAPKEIRDSKAIKMTVTKALSLSAEGEGVKGEVALGDRTAEYAYYDCIARGMASSGSVRWTFEENEVIRNGIGTHQVMSFTVPMQTPFDISVQTTCNVIRPGIAGLGDKIRTLVFGHDASHGRARPATISPPEKVSRGWFRRL
ncbi:MAG: hypothetical protein AAF683_15865 [Pseudomonadota bacterium]